MRNKRYTVLVLASTYPRWKEDAEPGFVHELCRRLTSEFNVIALVPDAPGADPPGDFDGVNVVRFRYAPRKWQTLVNDGGIIANLRRSPWKWLLMPIFVLSMLAATWSACSKWKPDVVHAHWLLPQGLIGVIGLALRGGVRPPLLVTIHGADLYALRSKVLIAIKRFVARRASAISVVSSGMLDDLKALGATPSKVFVQSMGVDLTNRFTINPVPVRSHDEILFVGRLVEKKGLRYLIEALPHVLQRHPQARLTVAGFGPEEKACRIQVEKMNLSDKVTFLGPIAQSDLPALYRRAAVFVAPFVQAVTGDREGLGLVVLEAAGCGCPVVVSDFPATREMLHADEAIFVTAKSPQSLGVAINNVLARQYEKVKAAEISESLRLRFDWDVVSSRYASIVSGMIRDASSDRGNAIQG